MPAPQVWRLDARVGQQGGWAWATPDQNDTRRGVLAPGMALQVMQAQGNWVLVRAENGWLGWTDARYLFQTAA